jgi:hypothetical protein
MLFLDRNFIQTPSPRYCRDLPGHEHTGGTEEGSIDGANKIIDNKVNANTLIEKRLQNIITPTTDRCTCK